MKYYVVCLRDRVADVFGVPSFVASLGSAVRGFSDEANRSAEDNLLFKHPEDFELMHIGTFDDSCGKFECLDVPKQLAVGSIVAIRGKAN